MGVSASEEHAREHTPATYPATVSPDVAAGLPLLLRTVAHAQQRMRNAAAGEDCTGTQISVMTAVVNNPGLDHRSVCKATFIDASTVASVVRTLAERGLLRQQRSRTDRRRYELYASEEAWERSYASQELVRLGNDELLSPLKGERRTRLIASLQAIAYAGRGEQPEQYVIPRPHGHGEPYRVPFGLGRLVRGSLQRHARIWAEELQESLTSVQYLALRTLGHAGAVDQRALGEITLIDKATLTVLLQRLERAGLVERVTDTRDRRRRLLAVSPAGRSLLRTADDAQCRTAARFLSPLELADQGEFVDSLEVLASHARREFLPYAAQRGEV